MKNRVLLPLLSLLLLSNSCKDDDTLPTTNGTSQPKHVEVVVDNLWIPWGLAFLPNGDLLFSERNGNFNLLKEGTHNPILLTTRNVSGGEGGLLGVCIDPLYEENHFVYAYETYPTSADPLNRLVRYQYENETLTEDRILFDSIPAVNFHNGGGIAFGPDGFLYVGTGDAGDPPVSQDLSSPAGKILRLTRHGEAAPGNPFNNFVWTYGHRNVQGFDWTEEGVMIATEHGPTADLGWCCHDEINRIEPGQNYGWPYVHAGNETDSLTPPLDHSGYDTWAPCGGMVVKGREWADWEGDYILCGLRGERMIRFEFDPSYESMEAKHDTLFQNYGRLRSLTQAPDGSIWFTTSNFGGDFILRLALGN